MRVICSGTNLEQVLSIRCVGDIRQPTRGCLTHSRGTCPNTETTNDCGVVCTAVVLHVRPRFCGTTGSTPASTGAQWSPICVSVIALLLILTVRGDCALRSFEIAELFLLLGAEKFVNLGLHAGVRDD